MFARARLFDLRRFLADRLLSRMFRAGTPQSGSFRAGVFQSGRSQSGTFQSRMRSAFEPRKPRHRLLRFVLGAVGLGLLVLLVMFGLVVGVAMLAVGLAYRLWARRGKPIARAPHDPRVVDAQYRVVSKPMLSR